MGQSSAALVSVGVGKEDIWDQTSAGMCIALIYLPAQHLSIGVALADILGQRDI